MLVNTINKRIIFYTFLIINALCWSFIELSRNIMSTDAMEAISWGELISFGTNKHPPLSGWLASLFFNGFGQNDFGVYLLGQICLMVGLIYVYKLAKCFVDEEKAICSSLILCSCFYYTYQTFTDNYNCNIISMGLWPVLTYYFYKATRENKIKDWLLFGFTSGLSILGKYQVAFLFVALFLYLIFVSRDQFKKKGLYVAILAGLLTILPHLIWLINNDFFSLLYILGRTEMSPGNTPQILLPFGRVVFPIKFLLDQLLALVPCIILYLIIAWKEKNISIYKINNSDVLYLLFIGLIPLCLLAGMGFLTNSRVIGTWGSTMIYMSGIILFTFFPVQFSKNTFSYFVKWIVTLTVCWYIGLIIFSCIQTKLVIGYPHKKIMNDFNTTWDMSTKNSPLKYVGGNWIYIFQYRVYNPRHPKIILETFGHINPWVNHQDIYKSGALIIAPNINEVIERSKQLIILLPDKYRILPQKYTFDVCNKLNQCRQEEFYYAIIPPQK